MTVHRGRFALACLAAAIVILWAPFVSEIRRGIRAAFPGQFVMVIGGAIAATIALALAAALWRIRERRAARYGAIAAAVVLGVAYASWSSTGRPESDVVEHVHFVQFGIVTLLFYRAWRPLGDASMFMLPVLAGLLVGTIEEWFQWFIPVRVGEMRDIFLNTVAIGCGLLFSVAVDPPDALRRGFAPGSLRRVGRFAAAVAVAIAAFFHAVHLGYEIQDEEVGRFRSRYSASQLGELAAARAREWRVNPPPLEIPRLSREDQYMTEGVEHVRERNWRWDAGEVAGAWLENRILEKYFTPVIETPSYHSKTGHRWPDEQRRNAESAYAPHAAAGFHRTFVSEANAAPIYTWPRWLFWTSVLGAALATAAACHHLDARRPAAPAAIRC